ncbi:unnamed protein product [Heterobilharzia americana]|nr:unnamed protein product [Heterobilharzia americana]
MTCESLLGLEDAMDEFLQSVDLFDDIDVGELDFASKASELLENSDSDSGISVAGEKHMQQLEVDAQPNCTDTDRVLTDVVGSSKHFTPNVLFKNDGCAKYQALNDFKETSGGTFVKISSSNPSIPKFKRITVNVLGGKRLLCNSSTISSGIDCSVPVTGVIPTTSKYLGIPVKLSPDSPSSIQSSNFSPSSSTSSPIKPDLNRRSLGELFSGVNGANEVYEYCGSSSPTDSILQEHLQNVSCTTYSNSFLRNHTHLSPTSLLDMQDFSGPNECIISHTNLERIRKKQERMIKNRQAACLSRLRKKEYLERLEMKFEQLKRENLALWRQNEEWRMRCSQLERCIEDLQSRFPSPTNSEITNSKCRPVELGAIKIPTHLQSNNGVTPTISNKTVSVHAITPQSEVKIGLKSNTSVITHPSSFFESGRSKTISIQNWKNSQDKNVNSKAAFPISMNSSKTFKWDSSSKRLLSNKVDVESHSQLSLHQSSVPRSSVTRTLLTPRRFGSTVTQRSKVIATTSLLAIFGLFTLNILSFSESTIGYNILPALSSIGMLPSGDQVGSQKIAFGKTNSWSSMHHPLTGRRLSIDIKPTQGDILVDDELIQASPNDNFITSEAAAIGHSSNNCGPNKNISCSENSSIADVRQILQGWIERHAVSTSNQSRVYRLLLTSSIHNLKRLHINKLYLILLNPCLKIHYVNKNQFPSLSNITTHLRNYFHLWEEGQGSVYQRMELIVVF